MVKHVLIFDPVPFKGGSKKVAQSVLSMCPKDVKITVVSNDNVSWQHLSFHFLPLLKVNWLINQTQGGRYFLKHLIFCITLLFYIIRFGRPSKLVGISGPTVDFTLYILGTILRCEVIQLIQGDVPSSSVARYCLKKASAVFYLKSTEYSIKRALLLSKNSALLPTSKFSSFINSVKPKDISTRKGTNFVGVLWAASLQRWKRVEKFVHAFQLLQQNQHCQTIPYQGDICFIGNINKELECDVGDVSALRLHHDPENLDQIRSQSSIFVSTSVKEPFGLAILESMLAGLVIVIPSDNAFWDQQLSHGINCLKYDPAKTDSLFLVLVELIHDQVLRTTLAKNSQQIAQNYTGLRCYEPILNCIIN